MTLFHGFAVPRVDLAFPHLFTDFPPRIRASLTNLSTDPTTLASDLPDDRRLPDVRHLTRHRTSAKHRTTGTPTTERFYRISGLHRTSDPSRPTGRPVTSDVRHFLTQLILFSYVPPSATTYLPPTFRNHHRLHATSLESVSTFAVDT